MKIRHVLAVGAALAVATAQLPVWSAAAPAAHAAVGDVGYVGPGSTGSGSTSPTADKPENKLWNANGSWWADMWSTTAARHSIFQLDDTTKTWVDTGVAIDDRANTQADTLYRGGKLYVSSHVVAASSVLSAAFSPTRLYRYSWTGTTWALDAGFPLQLNDFSSESLTIDVDATGTMWAAWAQNKQVMVTASTGPADGASLSFMTPWTPSVPGTKTTLTADDIVAVVASSKGVLLLWSNQVDFNVYFGVHANGAAATAFTGGVAAGGPKWADDHINLKVLENDDSGRVYAVMKTSRSDAAPQVQTDPQIVLLSYAPTAGWRSSVFGTVADEHTRPILLIDQPAGDVYVFATAPSTPGVVAYTGTIYYKVASLANPVFAPGPGTPFIRDIATADMNNATSTRQSVSAATGLVVLASNMTTQKYWWNELPLAPQAPSALFTTSATSGPAPLSVHLADASTFAPTSWAWDFGDGTTSTLRNPDKTWTTPGTYTVRLTVSNAQGSSTTTTTVTAATTAPVASFTATPPSGGAPLPVQFTDTSANTPTSWAWDFGDGSASTEQNPNHTYASPGTYTVRLTATNANGSGSTSGTVTATSKVLYRIAAGSNGVAGSPAWSSDTATSPSPYTNAAASYSVTYQGTKVVSTTDPSVPAGTPAALFGSHRYDVSKGAPMQWALPVPNGTYTVRLYFAETWSTMYSAGARVFKVSAEGSVVLPSVDVYAEVGKLKGEVKTFTVPVTDGRMDLTFSPIKGNPFVSGIEVINAG